MMLDDLSTILQKTDHCCLLQQPAAKFFTLTFGEIATMITNLVIAFVLQHYLASRSEVRRAENRILAAQIEDAFYAIRECQQGFQACIGKKPTKDVEQSIIAAVECISSKLSELAIALGLSHCKDMEPEIDQIISSFLQYKRALTGNNFPNRKFTTLDQADSQVMQSQMTKKLQSLLFRIGKHR